MIAAATLATAYSTIDALSGSNAYWGDQLLLDANGNTIPPDDESYYVLRVITDPATSDFDSEAYSRPVLRVEAWGSSLGDEYALRDSAVTALTAINWERLDSFAVPSARGRHGLATQFVTTA